MTNYNTAEENTSACDGKHSIEDDEYLTTIDGRTALLEGTPLDEVIQVFADKGLGTWFQITEIRDDDRLSEYDTEAVYAVVEFLKELGVVNEDIDLSVSMEDTYQNRALLREFTEEN